MNEKVKKDILNILKKAIKTLRKREEKDIIELRELSNHTIHNASIYQDEDSISIAVLMYSLAKIIERLGHIDKSIFKLIKHTKHYLEMDNYKKYKRNIKLLFTVIKKTDSRLKMYIMEVVEQAEIKKGSKLYEHGISLARASELMNISQWELMNYIGKTRINDISPLKVDIHSRIAFVKELFEIR